VFFAVKYRIRFNFPYFMAQTVDSSHITPRRAAADSAAAVAVSAAASQAPVSASYEAALAELEALVGQMVLPAAT
jgi:hypothetical protein